MALSNHERVGKALELLRDGLAPFVKRELEAEHGKYWITTVTADWPHDVAWDQDADEPHLDCAVLLRIMWEQWNQVFKRTLGHTERSLVSELRETRNRWAHQNAFSTDDAYRAMDSAERLLTSISAPQATELAKMKMELLRVRFDEQMRNERRRSAGTAIETTVAGNLRPWREVVSPHPDVASGRYQEADFAADLWQVHLSEGAAEYRDPVEFFRRTYLTDSLKHLLVNAVRRLSGIGGDPVVQLQTNFGGGKTHSMLALYHFFSGAPAGELPGIDEILITAETDTLPRAKRVVLVGNRISPGNPAIKEDGTVVKTLWGELAWQLGGREAYERVRADDENATNPGDELRRLFKDYAPCLILIDEWVAYARQLHDQPDLPAGSFDTQFSFAQALTESAKLAKQCLLVISLPASDAQGSPHTRVDDVEVGGQRGREALDRLRNVIGRVESSWRPATAEEGFEIVRRRLFEPFIDQEQFVARDAVARAFCDFYRTQREEFPRESCDAEYERRMKAAYPIHPEVFDRLYTDWSTLVSFQRTRGVLRLMAAVIHSLWEKGDRNPLILPASIPIDDPRVQTELTRYLSDNWVPVIERDVDGPNSLPLRLDSEAPNLGKYSACRRVARTIYLGSAPTKDAANKGIEDRRVKLGCVMPGESPAVFGDALRRLAGTATFLYQDGTRYWYSTQPTVTKLAEDRAEQYLRDTDTLKDELYRRIRVNLRDRGDFQRVHAFPSSGQDVPDDLDSRLVVLGIDFSYSKEENSPARLAAKAILQSRGSAPRLYQNTLAFLAVDETRLRDLLDAIAHFLAWRSIVADKETLDLSHHQVRQAETQMGAADSAVEARIPEAYQWLLVPVQTSPRSQVEWRSYRLTGQNALAERASKRLRSDELLVNRLAPTSLKMELDRVPLWRGDHVPVRELVEDFARYLYLPRLQNPKVLLNAITEGLGLMTWMTDSFAYADSYDEESQRYRGMRVLERLPVTADDPGLLVKPGVALQQIEREQQPQTTVMPGTKGEDVESETSSTGQSLDIETSAAQIAEPPRPIFRRFYGSVSLDPARVGSEAGRIAEEVIAHLAGLVGASVEVTLEIQATVPTGVPDRVVRIVTENSRTLKFMSYGFEEE